MSSVILHSDCNSFYASVECFLNPKLSLVPVAVGGSVENRNGIILAKNELAKKFNVKTGEAIWQAKLKCPELVTVPPNFSAYFEFSKLTREIYLEYTDAVEFFGLDEAWLDVTGSERFFGSGLEIAKKINCRIKKELGITVSIGVSYNKIFAKLGSDYKKPDAITVISKNNYKNIAWNLPAGALLYVGPSTEKKLHSLGIYTIGDIATTPIDILKSHFGKHGIMLSSFANGYDLSPVAKAYDKAPLKSIGNSITPIRDLQNDTDVKIILNILCESVSRRLREQGFKCKTVSIQLRDKDLFSFTRQMQLANYSFVTKEIAEAAFVLFKKNYTWQKSIRSIGVSISDFTCNCTATQLSFLEDDIKKIRLEHLDCASDKIKSRYGNNAITLAVNLADKCLANFNPKEDLVHTVAFSKK